MCMKNSNANSLHSADPQVYKTKDRKLNPHRKIKHLLKKTSFSRKKKTEITNFIGVDQMATLQAFVCSSRSISSRWQRSRTISATLNLHKLVSSNLSLPDHPSRGLIEELYIEKQSTSPNVTITNKSESNASDSLVISKLHAILEAVSERVEMHKNIGEQRNSWNSLLLTSINSITLSAAIMSGIAATNVMASAPVMAALRLGSTSMYLAATGMLLIMNKIQPSQLVEEQRNATRLFKQLEREIQRIISFGAPTSSDVKEAMEKVLALDSAYPLPLLGVMLEKFPSKVEPAVWWPQQRQRKTKEFVSKMDWNDWNSELEEEMREVVKVLERKDKADYLRLGEKALKINKVLAVTGPLLTGLAAVGSALVGTPSHGSWAVVLGVVAGAFASIVNMFQHGGQVGMVLEMYRCNAGFFKLMEETINSNLNESDVERRENGKLLEMKVALQLGRSLSELRELSALSSRKGEAFEEFASKLF